MLLIEDQGLQDIQEHACTTIFIPVGGFDYTRTARTYLWPLLTCEIGHEVERHQSVAAALCTLKWEVPGKSHGLVVVRFLEEQRTSNCIWVLLKFVQCWGKIETEELCDRKGFILFYSGRRMTYTRICSRFRSRARARRQTSASMSCVQEIPTCPNSQVSFRSSDMRAARYCGDEKAEDTDIIRNDELFDADTLKSGFREKCKA